MRQDYRISHAALALLPLLLSPLVLFALAEGWIDFGGGEKDVVLVLPYFIWSLTFFVCAIVLILKRWPLLRWLRRSLLLSLLLLIALFLLAFGASWFGIA